MVGEVFGVSFVRTPGRDPSRITISVDPGTRWAIQVWQGQYVESGIREPVHPGPPGVSGPSQMPASPPPGWGAAAWAA